MGFPAHIIQYYVLIDIIFPAWPGAVPCYRRCRQMAVIPESEKVIKLDQDDEGWVDTHHGISESVMQ